MSLLLRVNLALIVVFADLLLVVNLVLYLLVVRPAGRMAQIADRVSVGDTRKRARALHRPGGASPREPRDDAQLFRAGAAHASRPRNRVGE
jgi:hypothetical protein